MCAKILDLYVRSWALARNYTTATNLRAVCIIDSNSANFTSKHALLRYNPCTSKSLLCLGQEHKCRRYWLLTP